MRAPSPPELLVDERLVRAALVVTAVGVPVALLAGGLAAGGASALAAAWGVAADGANAYAGARVSASGARSAKGIGIGRVLVALPVRLILLAGLLAVAVGPLGLPSRVVALGVCLGEICQRVVQSWLVMRGPSFIGPLTGEG